MRSYTKAAENREATILADSQRAIVIPELPAEDPRASERTYAAISLVLGMVFSAFPVAAYFLKGVVSAQRVVWDLNFTSGNASEIVECPPNRLWDNDSAVVAACDFFMGICANTSNVLTNSTFQFQQNETNYTGRCVDIQQTPRFEVATILFGVLGGLFFLGAAIYLIGRQKVSEAIDKSDEKFRNALRACCYREVATQGALRQPLLASQEAVVVYSGPAPRE